jgi:hypothetical protein
LLLGCEAPDLFAGVGAIAGPSVVSLQFGATGFVPSTNVANGITKCRGLAGSKSFATQIANIAYGDMDKDGPNAEFPYTFVTFAECFQEAGNPWTGFDERGRQFGADVVADTGKSLGAAGTIL